MFNEYVLCMRTEMMLLQNCAKSQLLTSETTVSLGDLLCKLLRIKTIKNTGSQNLKRLLEDFKVQREMELNRT